MTRLTRLTQGFDWVLILSIMPIVLGGLATMTSFGSEGMLFGKQLMWVIVGLGIAWSFA